MVGPRDKKLPNNKSVVEKTQNGNGNHTFKIDFQHLQLTQKLHLLFLIQERQDSHPIIAHANEHNHVHLFELLRFIKATLVITFSNMEQDIKHHVVLIERESLYKELVEANASKKMLQHLFAKTSRQIERDRSKHGVGKRKTGRPQNLRGQIAYEITGRWEELTANETDMARLLVMMKNDFPSISISSIYNLVSDL